MAVRTSHRKAVAYLIGLLLTALAAVSHSLGWFEGIELKLYDLRLRHFNTITASEQLLLIDIDDFSLEHVQRWPWDREKLASMVSVLSDLNAKIIALDIIFPEPQPPRMRLTEEDLALNDYFGKDLLIHDDIVFSEAIGRAGNVLVPMHFDLPSESDSVPLRKRLRHHLLQNFWDSLDASARALGEPPLRLNRFYNTVRQEAANAMTVTYVTQNPDATIDDVFERFGVQAATPEHTLFKVAWRQHTALKSLRNFGIDSSVFTVPFGREPERIVPPIPELTVGAGTAYVVITPDREDGVVRRAPLLIRHQGRAYKQLGFELACRLLDVPDDQIDCDPAGRITLRDGEGRQVRTIPVDALDGSMLINYHKHAKSTEFLRSFEHLPAAKLLEATDIRAAIESNSKRVQQSVDYAMRLVLQDHDYHELIGRLNTLEEQLEKQNTDQGPAVLQAELDTLRGEYASLADEAVEMVKQQYQALKDDPPLEGDQARDWALVSAIHQNLFESDFEAANKELAAELEKLLKQLRRRVEGRVCIIGSTATGAADFVPMPVFPRAPGVMIHANVLNTVLSGRFIRPVGHDVQVIVILMVGVIMTVLAASLGPRATMVAVVFLLFGYVVLNAIVLFQIYHLLLIAAVPMGLVVLCWSGITAYRQFTEERQKRAITSKFKQRVSPAVVEIIIGQRDELTLSGELREITLFFSDIKGFTTISEKLGPERTVALLNRYLDRMTEVLDRHHGTINKFLGDGIFAFFGAPEHCDDHAILACSAAIDYQAALKEFQNNDDGNPALHARIGIASGEAVVGDCGSSRQSDYTAIGDVVNLSSRLEGANKFFGTSIMITEVTKARAGERFVTRPLGSLRVVGKDQAVNVHELLGTQGNVAENIIAYTQQFTDALVRYCRADFKGAYESFQKCCQQRQDDPAAEYYLRQSQRLLDGVREPTWDPAVNLAEK